MKKPTAPADIWERIDDALREMNADIVQRPPDAVTVDGFARRHNVTVDVARTRLRKLCNAGLLKRVGRSGPQVFYVWKSNGVGRQ